MQQVSSPNGSTGCIGLSGEQRDLRESVRSFARRHVTEGVVRDAVEAKREQLPPFWRQAAEQGLLGLHVPEEAGGGGGTLLDTAVVVEELGRAMAPGPLLPTVVASAVLARAAGVRPDAAPLESLIAAMVDGRAPAAVALAPGTLVGVRKGHGSIAVSGESAPALGANVAALLLLPVRLEHATTWVVLPRSSVEVDDRPGERQYSHDLTRRLAKVRVDAVVPAEGVLAELDSQVPLDLAAALFAAEASGLADWATYTAADYARVREQFGRPIGQFQGVKHRSARMLAAAECARVCAWDAARAQTPGAVEDPREASLAAAVAAAVSVDAGFSTAKDCINTLGGVGFTWEHDAGLYLRRSQSLRILLGPAQGWQRRVAELILDGVRRERAVELPPEAEQVRAAVRAELAPARELEGRARTTYLAEHGYTCPHLAAPWGREADAVTQLVIAEELSAGGLDPHNMVVGNWVVPTLIAHGTQDQMRRFIPPSLRGDIVWCQLFSEPGAGSDLAGVKTRAERVPGGWQVSGQKVWTSMAREAHFGILLARTDPAAAKHDGLSYFVVDMRSAGIDARPLRELTGDALFNEVFLDDVFVPDDMLVGQPGEGWKLARTTLMNERVALSNESVLGNGCECLVRIAETERQALDAHRLTVLGRVLCDAQSHALFGLRNVIRSVAGGQPGAESSVAKLVGVAHMQEVWELAMEWVGAEAVYAEPERLGPTWSFLSSRNLSIAGGTTDVQLNIVAERLLGLPRDPSPKPAHAAAGPGRALAGGQT